MNIFKNIDNAILYMLGSALISALNGAMAKILSQDISALEIVFFRNLIGVGLILYALKHTPPTLISKKFHLLFTRGLFGFIAMILFFYTITTIPLAEAITLNKTSPLFVAILAYYLLNESLNTKIIFALGIGFVGIIFIMQPFNIMISYEHILGILGGFFAAAAYTTIKKIKNIYDSRIIVLSFVGVGSFIPAVLFCIAPFIDAPQTLSFLFPTFILPNTIEIWGFIIIMAIISTLSQWLLTKAYSSSRLSIVGVISYTNIPFAIGFGYILGDKIPNALTLLGIGFIVIGGYLVTSKNKTDS